MALLVEGAHIEIGDLAARLAAAADRDIVLAVDRGARFESFSGVVEELQRHGEQRVSILVENGR